MSYTFVTTESELAACCQSLKGSEFLALDTEFLRERTYFPKLALIQVGNAELTYVIDPLVIDDMSAFYELIYDPSITKVLHSARQDYEIFYHLQGKLPGPIFDTQVAASLLGYGEQIGYANLVKTLLDIEVDKSQTRTDWTRRPLNDKQLSYAAGDVIHLAELYPMMLSKLEELDRVTWLQSDFELLTSTATYEADKRSMWKKIKQANRLTNRKLAIVRELAAWREERAIERDLPRKYILSDDNIVDIANQKPSSIQSLRQIRQFNQRMKDNDLNQILECIKTGEAVPDDECPRFKRPVKPTTQQSAIVDILSAIVQLNADRQNISPAFICSRKDLTSIVCGDTENPLFSGWRNELVGKAINTFLNGDSSLRIEDDNLVIS